MTGRLWARMRVASTWAYVVWAARMAGYWIRPYDSLADARRWRWRRRHPCQFRDGLGVVLQRWQEEDR